MYVSVDWLSFTLKNRLEPITHSDMLHSTRQLLRRVSQDHEHVIFEGETYRAKARGRSYRLAMANMDNGITLYGGGPNQSILLELSGKGCARLGDWERQIEFIRPLHDRITRLDIACDMEGPTRPLDFQGGIKSKRFGARSHISSRTGETVYIGSPKSDRFLRVYRYSNPHPRAHLLRAEFVFRGKMARAATNDMLQLSQGKFITALGNTYVIESEAWDAEGVGGQKLRGAMNSRKNEDTIAWLYQQVAPAITRLISEGSLDIKKWLSDEFGLIVVDNGEGKPKSS